MILMIINSYWCCFRSIFKLFGKLFKIILILGIPALIPMGVSFPFIHRNNQKQNSTIHETSLTLTKQNTEDNSNKI